MRGFGWFPRARTQAGAGAGAGADQIPDWARPDTGGHTHKRASTIEDMGEGVT